MGKLTERRIAQTVLRPYIEYMNEPEYGRYERYEKRSARRHPLSVPVVFETGKGRTRDMSATGIYFETESEVELGPIQFAVTLDTSGDHELLQCEGQVIRIDERPAWRGVAARIDRLEF